MAVIWQCWKVHALDDVNWNTLKQPHMNSQRLQLLLPLSCASSFLFGVFFDHQLLMFGSLDLNLSLSVFFLSLDLLGTQLLLQSSASEGPGSCDQPLINKLSLSLDNNPCLASLFLT